MRAKNSVTKPLSSDNSSPLFTDQTQGKIFSHKQLYGQMLVTGFGYLLAIITKNLCFNNNYNYLYDSL
jgi:hypothetical protein